MNTTSNTSDGMQDRLVAAAVQLLAEHGPTALQARRLAREVGASTMAVYHYFGGMPQLLAAVIQEGFRRLENRLAAVPTTDDPIADLVGMAFAYRAAARDNPHLYDLMFGLATPGGHQPEEPSPKNEPKLPQLAYGHLVTATHRAIRADRISHQDPRDVAAQLWSLLHGYITLELSGHFNELDGPTHVFKPMGINLLVGLGDTPERAARSANLAQQTHSTTTPTSTG